MAGTGMRCCNQTEPNLANRNVRRSELHAILSGRNCEPEGKHGPGIHLHSKSGKRFQKLNQVLHLLEGRAKKTTRARRKISAAGRRSIAAAQRARWAKIRAGK